MKSTNLSDRIIDYIVNLTLEELRIITIMTIAKHFRISKMHLIQIFKKQKCITPGKFLVREKMYRAASLMEKEREITVKEVSAKFGFSTSDYFIRVFKKHFGMPPCRYRDLRTKNGKKIAYKPNVPIGLAVEEKHLAYNHE